MIKINMIEQEQNPLDIIPQQENENEQQEEVTEEKTELAEKDIEQQVLEELKLTREDFTSSYNTSMEIGDLESAEKMLDMAEKSGLVNTSEYDYKQAELFNQNRDTGNWESAERLIASTCDYYSQRGRIESYESSSGNTYTGVRVEQPKSDDFSAEEKEQLEITNVKSFRDATSMGNVSQAETWLNTVKNNPDKFPQYNDECIDHRENELMNAYVANNDWDSANRIIESMTDSAHAQKYNSRDGRINWISDLANKGI